MKVLNMNKVWSYGDIEVMSKNDPNESVYLTLENEKEYLIEIEEPKTGHWIKGDSWSEGCGMGENYGCYYKCSNCGRTVKEDYLKCSYNYCPNCGAKMEEVDMTK